MLVSEVLSAVGDFSKATLKGLRELVSPPTLDRKSSKQLAELLFHPDVLKEGERRISTGTGIVRSFTISADHPHSEVGRIIVRHQDHGLGTGYVTSLALAGPDESLRVICYMFEKSKASGSSEPEFLLNGKMGSFRTIDEVTHLIGTLHDEFLRGRARMNHETDVPKRYQKISAITGSRGDLVGLAASQS